VATALTAGLRRVTVRSSAAPSHETTVNSIADQTVLRLLVVDPDAARRRALSRAVRAAGWQSVEAASAGHAMHALSAQHVSAVLVDAGLSASAEGVELRNTLELHAGVAWLVVADATDFEKGLRRIDDGATEYLIRPVRPIDVRLRVEGAFERMRLLRENASFTATVDERIAVGARKYEELFLASLQTLADALEVKDAYTWGHSIRVSEYAMAIARELELPATLLEQIEFGSRLHDIGKIGVREAVLNKVGPLTEEEYAHVMAHPVIGWRLLEPLMRDMPHALAVVRWHHERIDGRGVPDRLHSTQIPIEARITAVADSFDAMTSGRPYQAGVGVEEALAELWRCAGTQFCTECVAAFARALESGAIARPDWTSQRPLRAVRIVA
jgi:putative two-component system response regulator